ncbi:hypothetical protein [Alysiella filiformis]|uniref:Uncharacterized protein n=1 Tax=Alysiella filiformis DSM 16848 TaxID=1120981 RepID=A0A286E825_9NEIS|nr:hypothetical protein [Alysiella filiformis]QMT32023.1 hypothetical protein H3L97_03900 [Alysiella filiformis]UBQ57068.1 hypothetical protein JF568_04775 [Alysiella filiformis DSM 16848]SOD67004.1 hypothetical protein SAMN02746062_00771 [Alysiella filiformis DSM 16848]
MLIVENKEELETAINNKVDEFIIVGELFDLMKQAETVKQTSKWILGLLALSLVVGAVTNSNAAKNVMGSSITDEVFKDSVYQANFFNFAESVGVENPTTATTIAGISMLIYSAIAVIGISVLIAFYYNYNTVEVNVDIGGVIKTGMKCSKK